MIKQKGDVIYTRQYTGCGDKPDDCEKITEITTCRDEKCHHQTCARSTGCTLKTIKRTPFLTKTHKNIIAEEQAIYNEPGGKELLGSFRLTSSAVQDGVEVEPKVVRILRDEPEVEAFVNAPYSQFGGADDEGMSGEDAATIKNNQGAEPSTRPSVSCYCDTALITDIKSGEEAVTGSCCKNGSGECCNVAEITDAHSEISSVNARKIMQDCKSKKKCLARVEAQEAFKVEQPKRSIEGKKPMTGTVKYKSTAPYNFNGCCQVYDSEIKGWRVCDPVELDKCESCDQEIGTRNSAAQDALRETTQKFLDCDTIETIMGQKGIVSKRPVQEGGGAEQSPMTWIGVCLFLAFCGLAYYLNKQDSDEWKPTLSFGVLLSFVFCIIGAYQDNPGAIIGSIVLFLIPFSGYGFYRWKSSDNVNSNRPHKGSSSI